MLKRQCIYDFEICDGFYQLKALIATINEKGYTLVSVTQQEHVYTVFFRRPVDG